MSSQPYELVERIARGLQEYLGGQDAADKIADVAARYTGAEALDMPAWTVSVGQPRIVGVAHFPHLFIVPDKGEEIGDGLGWGVPSTVNYTVEFAVLTQAPEEEDVNWLKWRYLLALTELLAEMKDPGGYEWANWGVGGPTTFYYLQTYTNQAGLLTGDARLISTVQVHE